MRSAVAKQHGLDEELVAELRSPTPDLTPAQLAALRLADTLMADPAGVTDDVRDELHRHFSRSQIIELCLDVMKWNYQKVAVALGIDRQVVPGELAELAFDRDGNWIRPGS